MRCYMGPQVPVRSWTLMGLIVAFIDLALAHFLLCVSALGFFASKFLNLFGFFIPCPCRGVLGFVDSRLCIHKLFVEIPLRNIVAVQVLIKSRFPFSPVCYEEEEGGFDFRVGRRRSGGSESWLIDSSGDVRGKGVLIQKQQRPARRRRRVAIENGKCTPSSRNFGLSSVSERFSVHGGNEGMRSEIGESLTPLSGFEENFLGADVGEKSWQSIELSESFEVGNGEYIDSSCAESFIQETRETVTDELNKTKVLEKAFEELKAAYNALALELEKERSAAATAAEEAMAMISRLQNEKASIEMEVRQNQRMVDEKLAYDEEEMNILKEILVRREMENFVLENEIEAFKQMMSSNDKNLEEYPQDEDKLAVRSENPSRHGFSPERVFPSKTLELGTSTSPEILERNGETHKCMSCDRDEATNEVSQVVYDVHVIDDTTEMPVRRTEEKSSVIDVSSDVGLEGFGSIRDTERSSFSNVGTERLRLDSEVEWLREMLRRVQEEKEKLKLSAESRDKGRLELKLLEEIRDQLQEIQMLRGPLRHASLPPLMSKASLKRSGSQSTSWNAQ